MSSPKKSLFNIGYKIKAFREANNLTQEQLADLMNCNFKTVGNLENDRTVPDLKQIINLCDVLNISMDELFADVLHKTDGFVEPSENDESYPFFVNRAWFYPRHLDEAVMQRAADQFVGTHDFAAVRSVGTDVKSTVRTVYYYRVERRENLITLKVCANGFLYNMARAMAGTVVYAAEGKIQPEQIGEILNAGNRTAAGPTVPPGGLYMTHLWYDDGIAKFECGSDWTR